MGRLENIKARRREARDVLTGHRRRVPAVAEPLLVDEVIAELEAKLGAGGGLEELAAAELFLVAEHELEGGLAGAACRVLEGLRQEREFELEAHARRFSALVLEVRP